MFGLKNVKFVKKLSDIKPNFDWLNFSAANASTKTRNDFIEEIVSDNEFIRKDMKLRAMVEEMLVKEFSEDIKNIKSYDFLVDSVVNRLKKGQLESVPTIKAID